MNLVKHSFETFFQVVCPVVWESKILRVISSIGVLFFLALLNDTWSVYVRKWLIFMGPFLFALPFLFVSYLVCLSKKGF